MTCYNEPMHKTIRGFTIIELLSVIVIISLLMSITVISYSKVQNNGYDASVLSDLRSITSKMEIARSSDPMSYFPVTNPAIAAAIPDMDVSKSAYKTGPDVAYNLLLCWVSTATPTDFMIAATSKSGKRFYMRSGNAAGEYTGATTWADSNVGAICGSVLPGSSASGAGYAASDAATGPWRSWTGN